ncbi:NAD-dependent epimerase/dehydratase family protein [Hymenobacter properus]|uniref:ATP-grasp domain-containing protein n=1 Tax=Hymenobacter properus TaxID=2791026 RepID=A0A931BKG4_9BACT|nr:NAD-dependent epimerase/dehydratase family protein [Hymenobacter properus]MBF9143942.1 ATP-grasp domain-containing protein [Hymenobacter properus]MBR7722757.1 ATP-grasp domain-containing protein [Microvirga sp. SRT04]
MPKPLALPFKRIFISGGAGVIGQEMVRRLATLPNDIEVLVGDLKPRPADFPARFRYRQGDLNFLTEQEIGAFAPEVFIHLAATFERSTESYGFWEENFRHNVQLSHHLMTVQKDLHSLRRVVFASSYLIYDPELYNFAEVPAQPRSLRETDPILPRNLTGMAKLAHEIELRFLQTFRGEQFSTAIPRIYRGYGRNGRDITSRWVRMLLAGEEITVYGAESFFDYLYAADTAEGLLRLAAAETVTGIINLGTGRARRVSDVVDVLKQNFPNLRAKYVASDIPFEASQADMTLWSSQIDWLPPTSLEEAIPEIIAFERARQETPAAKAPGHVLISSVAAKVPLVQAVRAAAQRLHPDVKVIGGDMNPACLARHFTDDFWLMPATADAHLEEIITHCRAHGIAHVIPTRDGELAFWSRHRAALAEAGIAVLVSEPEAVTRCLDKLEFEVFGRENGLPVIPTALGLDGLAANAQSLGTTGFVVKERHGAGSLSLGLNLPEAAALAHARSLEEPVFQPFISGQEISVDAYVDRTGQVRGLVPRTRDVIVRGESQVTTTISDPALVARLIPIVEKLGLYGPLVLQALLTSDGGLHLIECNCRFGGASTLGVAAGVDSFFWFLQEAAGADLSQFPFRPAAGPLRQVRAAADVVTAV